jgi:hypothetical protein
MKNTIKFLGIIALVAVIGFSMAACGDGDDNGGGGGSSKSVEATVGDEGMLFINYNGDEDMAVTVTTTLPSPNNKFTMNKVGDTKEITGLTPGQKVTVTITVTGTISKLEAYYGYYVGFQVYKH